MSTITAVYLGDPPTGDPLLAYNVVCNLPRTMCDLVRPPLKISQSISSDYAHSLTDYCNNPAANNPIIPALWAAQAFLAFCAF